MYDSDPAASPVIIIGQLHHLQALDYNLISCKLSTRVSEEIYKLGLAELHPSPSSDSSCPLYLNLATLVSLPKACSRHNTPSRSYTLTKIAKKAIGVNGFIVVVCEKSDVFATACGIAKAFPTYNKKTSDQHSDDNNRNPESTSTFTTTIEILLVDATTTTHGGTEFTVGNDKLNESELELLNDTSWAIRNAAKIVDTPCSKMHTDQFIQEAQDIATKLGITPTMIRGEELKEQGFGGIYSVGRAAEHPPVLIALSHTPKDATETVAWVGKGIVYDTGGLSLKGKEAMCGMKTDCGGAAAILNAFYIAVKSGFKQNLHAVLCVAENSIGPLATRPDDVLTMYSKKTVEVNNTDAEGRLVLADGVVYAKQNLNANIIIDMATLTSAQGVATGKYHCALLTNSEDWESAGRVAGRSSGELVFPLVFSPELHFSEFSSTIADMKNSVARRDNATSSCAGLFIMSHLGFDFNGIWAHFDIAGLARIEERATGFGVALLNTLFGHMSSSQLLNKLSPWETGCNNTLKQ